MDTSTSINTDEENAAADEFERIRGQIDELVGILDNNVQRLLDRHGNLDNLETFAKRLESKAREFKVITKRMKYKHVVRRHKWSLCIGLLVFVLVAIWTGVFAFWLIWCYDK
uniref:Synaptobrevin-like n=1 Tax=Crassostrea virginica TaxID=6565 RepID=A0A8B8CV84_CRAVI|nr:synaptobrevin-like [Crassostrea virginica]